MCIVVAESGVVMRNILIMSDIHGNLSALNKVLKTEDVEGFDKIVLLGDLIDYGPRSNEVLKRINDIPKERLAVNIWGNHEKAILNGDDSKFSSERGRQSAAYTRENLSKGSLEFLKKEMDNTGKHEFELYGKKCLAVHGSLADPYWKSISHEEKGIEYAKYDFVFSGHSHIPHFFEQFYPAECEAYRNKKKTVFINPGAVGQPRNHNPNAQYAVLELDTMTVMMKAVEYEISQEIELFADEVDIFYKERLRIGV